MQKERLRMPLYDTIVFLSAPAIGTLATTAPVVAGTNLFWFVVGQGGQGVGNYTKTYMDTNLTTAGQMPYSKYIVVGIRLNYYTRNDASTTLTTSASFGQPVPIQLIDYNAITNNSFILYQRSNRDILRLPTHWIPSGIGANVGGQATYAGNGAPQLSNLYKVLPETYKQTDTIQLSIQTINAFQLSNNIYIEALLEGVVDKNF